MRHTEGEKQLDPMEKITRSMGIPYLVNVTRHSLKGEIQLNHRLSVDDISLYTLKNEKAVNVISGFGYAGTQVLISTYIDRSYIYVDYSSDDYGNLKRNEGISSQDITLEIMEDGPARKTWSFISV